MSASNTETLFRGEGRRLVLDVSMPFLANDATRIWYINSGSINLSGTKVVGDEAIGKLQDFITLKKGQAFFGIALKDYNSLCFLASPEEESEVFELPVSRLREWGGQSASNAADLDHIIRDWVTNLYLGLEVEGSHPEADHVIRSGWSGDIEKNQVISTRHNAVWFEASKPESLLFNDLFELSTSDRDFLIPVSRHAFIRAGDSLHIATEAENGTVNRNELWKGLGIFHDVVMSVQLLLLNREAETERARLIRKHQTEDSEMASVLEQATAILSFDRPESALFRSAGTKSDFFNALSAVASYDDIKLVLPPNISKNADPLDEISRHSSIRYREINLEGEWYNNNSGPFLAFLKEGGIPVAVLPSEGGKFIAFNTSSGEKFTIDDKNSGRFRNFGYMLFKPLPAEIPDVKYILKFSLARDKSDYIRIFAMAFSVTLLGMLVPVLTSVLFDTIIPNAAKNQLVYVAFGLCMAALGAFLFDLTKSIALLRSESRMDQKIQAAVWDRLLNLPATFFRKFTAGDLAMRSLSMGQIRKLLSGAALLSVLSCLFSSLNLLLLFYYSTSMALVAIILVLIQVVFNYVTGRIQVRRQKELLAISGKTAGIVLQLLTGISKFRVTGTERRAFNHWMQHFLPSKEITIRLTKLQNIVQLFNGHYRMVSMMVIFVMMVGLATSTPMTIGEFLSFSAAYGIFSAAMMQMSSTLITLLQVFPLYERTKPILDEKPENTETKEAPEDLKGNIEINDVSFRYDEEGPYILKNLTMSIRSGEYIALVGPSGSGKSTVIRLLLGFNEASSGAIFYDGQDLSRLDARLVRRKIGVVLQDGSLSAGDIFTNIIGSSTNLTIDDAWKAAKAAAFDKDIEGMPMGMHTIVSESGATISGGQRQRLMIARALVHRPNILIFD